MAQESRTKKLLVNTGIGVLARVVNIITRFLLQTILLYTLGKQYTGISGLFTSIFTVLSLTELGMASAVSYALYEPLEKKDQVLISSIMNFFKNAYRIVACCVLILGLIIIPCLHYFIHDIPDIKENVIIIYLLFLVKTVASYLLNYKATLLIANQQNYMISKIQTVVDISRTIIECSVLIVWKSFLAYLALDIIAGVIQNIVVSFLADKQYDFLKKYTNKKLNKMQKKVMFRDIRAVAVYKASKSLGTGVDNIIVSRYVNTGSVGVLSNYILLKEQLTQFLNQFVDALVPSVGNLAVTNSDEVQYDVFKKVMFINFWITSFCSISFFVLVQPFVRLWLGSEYVLSLAIVAVIAMDFYLGNMINVIGSFRTANGLFVKGQYRPLIMTLINVFLSIVLGMHYGMFGVLFATVFSRLVTQWYDPLMLYRYIYKRSSITFFCKYYLEFLATLVIGTFIYMLCEYLNCNSLFEDFLIRILMCICIPNLLIIVVFRRTDEYRYAINKLKKILRKKGGAFN